MAGLPGLKRIRKEKRLLQEEIAHLAGVTTQYISFIECGRSTPSLEVTRALATALGVTVDELLREDQPGDSAAQPAAGAPDRPDRQPNGQPNGEGKVA